MEKKQIILSFVLVLVLPLFLIKVARNDQLRVTVSLVNVLSRVIGNIANLVSMKQGMQKI